MKALFSGGASPAAPAAAPAPSKTTPGPEPVAPTSAAAPRKSPYQGPLIAETGETCPQCGLTTVKTARGKVLTIMSFGAGIVLFVLCGMAIGSAFGWMIGLFVGIVAFFALRLRARPSAGKVCTTCGHRWS